jgi:hypothetical protein
MKPIKQQKPESQVSCTGVAKPESKTTVAYTPLRIVDEAGVYMRQRYEQQNRPQANRQD